jgi:hypothetical protein
MSKKKIVSRKNKQKLNRATYFVNLAKKHANSNKYSNNSKRFLNFFKPVFLKTRSRTFLIDLKSNFSTTPIAVALTTNIGQKKRQEEIIYQARIRFKEKKIVLESIQGSKNIVEIRAFEKAVNLPASRYLLQEIIRQAKKLGYKEILLRRPEAHPSYKEPAWFFGLDKRGKKLWEDVALGEATQKEKKEFEHHKQEIITIMRARMKKIYDTIAIAEGMKRKGNYYYKEI